MGKTKELKYYDVQKVNTIKQLLEMAVEQAGDKIAFKYKEGKDKVKDVTYKEFQEDTFELGTALNSINMADKHVAVIGDNSYKYVTVYLTVLKSKGVIVPIDKELPVYDIINVLNDSDSEVLFYAKKYEKDIEEIASKTPNVKYFIGFETEKSEGNKLSYNEFKAEGKKLYEGGDKTYTEMVPDHNSLKMLVYTSGTTGMAKGVMLSEHNLISIVYYGLRVSTVYDRCLSVLPWHHTYEAVAGILVSLHHHSTICINESLKAVLKNLQLYKPDYIYVVPAFVELFYKKIWSNAKESHKDKALKAMMVISNELRKVGIDLRKKFFKSIHNAFGGNLRKIVTGGAAVRPELGDFFDTIGIDLINGYGITECSPLVSANMDYCNDCSTVGFPLECVEIKLEDVTPEGDGEICVKGDIVMLGYYKQPEKTAEVLQNGWFRTGDYGKINDKGQLMITGRKKNLIVLDNGKNVFPEEIENYIMRIPYVQEVVVSGVKDKSGSEIALCAEVFLNEDKLKELNIQDKEQKLKKDISKECEVLPIYKRIGKIVIRDKEFEKTTTNKIKR